MVFNLQKCYVKIFPRERGARLQLESELTMAMRFSEEKAVQK